MSDIVDRFLTWELPESVRCDPVACEPDGMRRTGTNLLTAAEAEEMLRCVLGGDVSPYLKDGETVATCIQRNRDDVSLVMGLLAAEKRKSEELEARLEQEGVVFQERVQEWCVEAFGQTTADDVIERNYRFLEETLELVQALGCTKQEALMLVDYVFNRPKGQPEQEVGGVMVTLGALCAAQAMDMQRCGETELERCWEKINQIREKQKRKPLRSPLPGEYTDELEAALEEQEGRGGE